MARHASLAEQLTAVLAHRTRPEAPVEPVKTNWTTVPANDNAAPEEIADMAAERSWRMTPSVQEIMRSVAMDEVERNDAGQIVRIGRLRFSDGTQTERAFAHGPDGKLVKYDATMPVGAMLGTRDNPETQLGGTAFTPAQTVRSNISMAQLFDVGYPTHKAGKKRDRREPIMTQAEQIALLAEARANGTAPAVTKCAPALASGTERAVDNFVGLKKGRKGETGSMSWEDIATSRVNLEIWEASLEAMNEKDRKTLDALETAKTMADLAPANTPRRTAYRAGKARLLAANDNLMAALKKNAA